MASAAQCASQRATLMQGGRRLQARIVANPDVGGGFVLDVKDSRSTPENEAQTTDGYRGGSWNPYNIAAVGGIPAWGATFS